MKKWEEETGRNFEFRLRQPWCGMVWPLCGIPRHLFALCFPLRIESRHLKHFFISIGLLYPVIQKRKTRLDTRLPKPRKGSDVQGVPTQLQHKESMYLSF